MDWIGIKDKMMPWMGKYRYVLLVLLAGLVLMMIPAKRGNETEATPAAEQTEVQTDTTEQLMELLSQIDGVGEVRVMLTVADGEETLYQTDTDMTDTQSRIETVIISDSERGESGLIRQVNPPTYRGAVVVCKGGDKAAVRLAVVEAVARLTGLGADCISVLKMK